MARNIAGYSNPQLPENSRRIFSKEDVRSMSSQEYSQFEKAIIHQIKTIGLPSQKDLTNRADVVHVQAYQRADGTKVRDYYRSLPDAIATVAASIMPSQSLNFIEDLIPEISTEASVHTSSEVSAVLDSSFSSDFISASGASPLVGGISTSSVVSPFNFSQIGGVVGVIGGIAAAGALIYLVIKNHEQLGEAAGEALSKLKENLAVMQDKVLSTSKEGRQISEILHSIDKAITETPTVDTSTKTESTPKYKGISIKHANAALDATKTLLKDLITEPLNSLNSEKESLSGLLDDIVNEQGLNQYKHKLESYKAQKDKLDKQSNYLNSIKSSIDNNQFENIIKSTESNETPIKIDYGTSLQGYISNVSDTVRTNTLNYANDALAEDLPDTHELMKHSIDGLTHTKNTNDYKVISSIPTELQDLLAEAGLSVNPTWYGLEYSSDSELAQDIANSPELQKFIKQNQAQLNTGKILTPSNMQDASLTLESTTDLHGSIHGCTVLKAYIDSNGIFHALVFDIYNFAPTVNTYSKFGLVNYLALKLQQYNQIHNYYILVDVKIDTRKSNR